MSHTDAEPTTQERKPPTIADIVREKTDDGRLIIDFFTDVMMGRIDGAELCHRIDAAKQLEKHKSKAAAEFMAKYKGVPCGHSINGRPDPADPCTAEDKSLVAVTLNAPPTLTRDFLTVLSRIDEFLMARLIRAQTAHGDTIIEFLDDVMQDRNDGFKTHHRIAAAKELIVHIVRDEQPAHTPSPSTGERWGEGDPPPLPQGEGWGEGDSPVVPAHTTVIPAKAGIQEGGVARPSKAGVHPDPNSPVVPAHTTVIPAKAGIQGRGGARNTAANSARTEPVLSTVEEPVLSLPKEPDQGSQLETNNSKLKTLPARRARTQRRREGAVRAAAHGKGSERIEEEKDEKPAPVELTPAERRINEKLEQHWHEPDPYGAPIDSTHPGRSPPW